MVHLFGFYDLKLFFAWTNGYWTYHRGVEAGHLGVVDLTAAVLPFVAGCDQSDDLLWIGVRLHVRQAFSPST